MVSEKEISLTGRFLSLLDVRAKLYIFCIVVLTFVLAVVIPLVPIAFKYIVDGFVEEDIFRSDAYYYWSILAYISLFAVSSAAVEVRGFLHVYAEQGIQRQLSIEVFLHVLSLPMTFHSNRNLGDLTEHITNGLLGFRMAFGNIMLTLLPTLLQLAVTAAIVLFVYPTVILLVIACSVAAYSLAFGVATRRLTEIQRAALASRSRAVGRITDTMLNYDQIRYFNGESIVTEPIASALKGTEDSWRRYGRIRMYFGFLQSAFIVLCLSVTIYIATDDVYRGTIGVGDLVLINTYIIQLIKPLEALGLSFREVRQGTTFLEEMARIMAIPTEIRDAHDAIDDVPTRGGVQFERVSFSYDGVRPILRDVSFTISPGQIVGIVGQTGSGKSTIAKLLMRMYSPSEGTISIDGYDVRRLKQASLHQCIGIVPQDTTLFNDTIRFNIAFGRTNATNEDIDRVISSAGLTQTIARFPDGLETAVGERGNKLSGGERQRVAIARLILLGPSIYVFDEATSSLDSTTEKFIQETLDRIAVDRTTIIIAHRLSTIARADKILVLDGGAVAEIGTHEELLRKAGLYASLWRSQSQLRESEDSMLT